MAKINNTNRAITTLEGEAIKTQNGDHLTLRGAVVEALLASFQGEQQSGEEKMERFLLAQRFYEGETVELTQSDLRLIRDLVGKAWGPLIVGRVYQLLDG